MIGRRNRFKRKKGPEDTEDEDAVEIESKEDELVQDVMTDKVTYWSHCHRGRWARWSGRHSLPKSLLKKAARRYSRYFLMSR